MFVTIVLFVLLRQSPKPKWLRFIVINFEDKSLFWDTRTYIQVFENGGVKYSSLGIRATYYCPFGLLLYSSFELPLLLNDMQVREFTCMF